MNIYLNASDIAACIGHNKYKTREEVVLSQWEKDKHGSQADETNGFALDETTTDKLVSALGSVQHVETLKKIRTDTTRSTTDIKRLMKEESTGLTDTLNNIVVEKANISKSDIAPDEKKAQLSIINDNEKLVINKSTHRVAQLNNELEEIKNQKMFSEAKVNKEVIASSVEGAVVSANSSVSTTIEKESIELLAEIVTSTEQLSKIKKATNAYVNTQRGKRHEDTIVNDYEKESGNRVRLRNDRMYYLNICEVSDRDKIRVGGKIDGFVSSTQTLIEVKRRRNRFLGFPKREKIQCEIYMRMLDIDKCVHVEEFDGERESTDYKSDAKLWEEIEFGLAEFKEFYVNYYNQLSKS